MSRSGVQTVARGGASGAGVRADTGGAALRPRPRVAAILSQGHVKTIKWQYQQTGPQEGAIFSVRSSG